MMLQKEKKIIQTTYGYKTTPTLNNEIKKKKKT